MSCDESDLWLIKWSMIAVFLYLEDWLEENVSAVDRELYAWLRFMWALTGLDGFWRARHGCDRCTCSNKWKTISSGMICDDWMIDQHHTVWEGENKLHSCWFHCPMPNQVIILLLLQSFSSVLPVQTYHASMCTNASICPVLLVTAHEHNGSRL